jgi:glycosyltransferase involved in cell wall biosynthesis
MKILVGITYYLPNVSGVTIYAKRLVEELVKKGHQVTVLTSHYDCSLPRSEVINGVEVIRSPVVLKIGKGVIMPFLPGQVFQQMVKADVVNCHLPQFESFVFAVIGKLFKKKVFLTHHTDLSGWPGILNRISEAVVWFGQLIAGLLADKILPYTQDYADHSWYLTKFKKKLDFVYPPITTGKINFKLKKKWKKSIGESKYLIGFAGRIARQKGIPYLLRAIPYLRKKVSSFKIVFVGPSQKVIGENYLEEIRTLVNRYRGHIFFLGDIPEREMSSFYSLCDVLVLPSDDRLESFGIVQIEAMLNGCPVVATTLPGVRVPIRLTKMGLLVQPRRSRLLARAIIEVLENREKFIKPRREIIKLFDYEETVRAYERIFSH